MTDVPRDRWGRYLVQREGATKAVAYTRATTIASTLSDSFGLTNWKLRTLAQGLALREDIYARVAAVDGDKTQLDRLCQDALEAGRASAGANFGTALHEAVARINRGETVTMPAPWNADLDTYRQTLGRVGVTIDPEHVERVVVLDDYQIAGTFDAIVTLPDGTAVIGDLKTGQSLDYSWGEIAIQLALYAHANAIYNTETGWRTDMPTVRADVGLIIHLPAGQAACTLHTIDLTAGWEAAALALDVRKWRTRKGLATPYVHDGPVMPRDGARAHMVARLEQARACGYLDKIAERWPPHIPTFKSGHDHTAVELNEIGRMLTVVEADVGAPF